MTLPQRDLTVGVRRAWQSGYRLIEFLVDLLLSGLICIYDALHKGMAHDILLGIFDNADSFYATQDPEACMRPDCTVRGRSI